MRLATRVVTALAVAGTTLLVGGAPAQAARGTDTLIRIERTSDTLIRLDAVPDTVIRIGRQADTVIRIEQAPDVRVRAD